ncbi:iron uptake porin [Microcoleus sp. bin38.metabat.b11b12b14.051]|uniref:iron uptake porin n=1 Tax=Microcoleus sp. bin38.metabat.b11b12b14.051 TaxID=2742709 RepID=UPI0025F1713E|nr:iron uptake porin [Microcoleus sp. bin38.metabat.b11b12b14.051]
MHNLNHKADRPNRQILTALILGWGLQGLFSLPALAEPSLAESPAVIENQGESATTEIAVDAPDTILPENQQFVDRTIQPSQPSLPESPTTLATLAEPVPSEIAVDSPEKMLVENPSSANQNLPANDSLPQSPTTIENQNEPISEESTEQVTSVAQLSDVKPTDWAFQALQSLVERYGCIAGYPDGTFRGNRALTRYEFAAGVNACLDKIREAIGTVNQNRVKQEDLLKIQRLQEEFAADIAQLRGRTDLLESRITELQANQFSPTVKLSGLTIFGIQGRSPNRADRAPRDGKKDTKDPGTNVNTIALNQLYLTAQFTPRSNLFIGLLSQNGSTSPQLTEDINLAYNFGETSGVTLSDLNYRFLVGEKLAVFAGTAGVNMISGFRGPNRAESAASGPISTFAQRNPILNIGFGQGGAGIDWQFAKRASFQAVYSTTVPGFFVSSNGPTGHNTLGFQFTLTPAEPLDLTVYYVNDYSPDGNLISFAGDSQLTAVNPVTGKSASLQTNAVGATVNWRVSSRVSLGGWAGYTNSRIPGKSGSVATTNYMVFVNFPDLFGTGNLGGIYIGQPPKIVSSNLPTGNNIPDFLDTGLGRKGGQPGTTTHVEAFYRWQVNDNISVTPGFMMIFQPDHTRNSDPITVGVLRTSFSF